MSIQVEVTGPGCQFNGHRYGVGAIVDLDVEALPPRWKSNAKVIETTAAKTAPKKEKEK